MQDTRYSRVTKGNVVSLGGRESIHIFRVEYLVATLYAPRSDTTRTKLLAERRYYSRESILERESTMVVDLCRFVSRMLSFECKIGSSEPS